MLIQRGAQRRWEEWFAKSPLQITPPTSHEFCKSPLSPLMSSPLDRDRVTQIEVSIVCMKRSVSTRYVPKNLLFSSSSYVKSMWVITNWAEQILGLVTRMRTVLRRPVTTRIFGSWALFVCISHLESGLAQLLWSHSVPARVFSAATELWYWISNGERISTCRQCWTTWGRVPLLRAGGDHVGSGVSHRSHVRRPPPLRPA
jgi:hypothetical protein